MLGFNIMLAYYEEKFSESGYLQSEARNSIHLTSVVREFVHIILIVIHTREKKYDKHICNIRPWKNYTEIPSRTRTKPS